MPLQQLVEYFNDRLALEQHSHFRPFLLQGDSVEGVFGPIRIGTGWEPIRETLNPERIMGYAAILQVAAHDMLHLQNHEFEWMQSLSAQQSTHPDSIIHFDRLSRTVHMLNFLPHSHEPVFLQLDVDPRHILGVKKDHGAYFQEVISQCGMATGNIVIAMKVSPVFAQYYDALITGLENYRQRGYRLALKFDHSTLTASALALISVVSPDWVAVSAKGFAEIEDSSLPQKLQQLQRQAAASGAQSLILDIDERQSDALARDLGFEWMAGRYYQPADPLWWNDFARGRQTFVTASATKG